MPRKVFLSFLGTNDYMPCTYFSPDGFEKSDTRFIQAALVEWRCKQWTKDDLVAIFLTKEASRKNWENDGHGNGSESCNGLQQCLKELSLSVQVKPVFISDGKTETEIWDIFDQVYSILESQDQVTMDITHAFRSIPMLAIVLLNYAKALKQVSISGIHYGAFEVLGSLHLVKKMPLSERRAPIFDLTAFDSLMAWSTGVDRFLSAGDATLISRLANENIKPILAESKGKDLAASAIRGVSKAVEEFSRILSTCRGKEISCSAFKLKSRVNECLQYNDIIKPFTPILQALSDKTHVFTGNELSDGIQAAEWCLKHNMIQQGYTILLEVIVTWTASLCPEQPGLSEIEKREIVSSAIHIAKHNKSREEWTGTAKKYPEVTQQYIEICLRYQVLLDLYAPLTAFRNDLNHAGFVKSAIPAESIVKKLNDFVQSARTLIPEIS